MSQRVARSLLRAFGWRVEGRPPEAPRMLLVAAPHTSNWDLLLMLLMALSVGLRPRFMMKHTVFVGPLGWLFERIGGIPVRRDRRHGLVKQMVEAFAREEEVALVIPPEGTRAWVPRWKSGFYHIACHAQVPLVLTYLDFPSRTGGIGPGFLPTGDVHVDMEVLRDFYADKVGRHPDQFGEIRLAEEGEPDADA